MSSNKNYSAIPVNEDQPADSTSSVPKSRAKKHLITGVIVCIASAILISSGVALLSRGDKVAPKRNVVMMISDGFGPASETFARQYHQWREDLAPKSVMLPLDEIHVGHSRTQSSSSLVTDSAAGATAFACGLKSYNGAIGVTPTGEPCGTVLESAKHHRGMLTGLVVTSRITHATPASFNAHVTFRDYENDIAEQQIGHTPLGRSVDLMFGGGSCEFLSNATEGSCRGDQRDLFDEAKADFGWTVKRTRQEFDAIRPEDPSLPLMAIFTPQEMTAKALSILSKASKDSDTGFFLMIEGSRIDMAAHSNDPATHVHEILEYQQTAELVKAFVRNNPDTVMISTSDHETGGLTVGRQVGEDYPEYKWNPEVISQVRNSSEVLAGMWNKATESKTATEEYLKTVIIGDGLGVVDPTSDEIKRVMEWDPTKKTVEVLITYLSDIVSRRALIGVILRGSHENTEIGDFIVDYLGLDLKDITNRLTSNSGISSFAKPLDEDYASKISHHQRHHD
ncbi:hypothetical protein [Absidia glauca]|uniref:Alkaline phosphatase n=1 Tax=Absidia glauca TaxID=4829 RepID=A0A163JML2_ABSGL|nr:hypothetical protein [Absidia glauca]